MPEKRAQRDGFVDKDKVVDYWLEGAMVALTCGRVRCLSFPRKVLRHCGVSLPSLIPNFPLPQFLDNPSVEAVRAVVVISTFFVFLAKGESSGAGMCVLSLAAAVSRVR